MVWSIPKWLSPAASQTTVAQAVNHIAVPWPGGQQAAAGAWSTQVYPVGSGSSQWVQAVSQMVNQPPPPLPGTIVRRNKFSELLHAIEDIDGRKFAYDGPVLRMLDMRPLRTKSEISLCAFCHFMLCNGVDPANIPLLVARVEEWGFAYV